MTDRLELVHDLYRAGARLTLDAGRLFAEPVARLTPELIARLRAAKPDLLRILAGPSDPCPHCGGRVVRDQTHDGYFNRFCVGCGRWLRCLPPGGPESVRTADEPSTEQRRLLCDQDPS